MYMYIILLLFTPEILKRVKLKCKIQIYKINRKPVTKHFKYIVNLI